MPEKKKKNKDTVLNVRVTPQEKKLLLEMAELLYKNGTIKKNTMSEILRYLIFSKTREIVGRLKDAK